MKYRTYTRLLALALSLTLLTACGPKEESGSQSNPDGSVSSSQGSVSTPDASQPDLSLPCLLYTSWWWSMWQAAPPPMGSPP